MMRKVLFNIVALMTVVFFIGSTGGVLVTYHHCFHSRATTLNINGLHTGGSDVCHHSKEVNTNDHCCPETSNSKKSCAIQHEKCCEEWSNFIVLNEEYLGASEKSIIAPTVSVLNLPGFDMSPVISLSAIFIQIQPLLRHTNILKITSVLLL